MNQTEPRASTPLHVAVIGGGAFGRNHLRVFSELAADPTGTPVTLSALVEPDAARRSALCTQYGISGFPAVSDLLQSGLPLDAATVCVPTVAHAKVTTELLQADLDVLIEKPMTTTLAEADALLALASTRSRILAVGHLERFNPAVTACFPRLTRPMFFEAHRLSIFTPRSLDVDVVLDLMIHDLDIVLSLSCSGVREVRAVGLPVLSSRVDIASARVEFDSGCIANFTASRVSTEQVRKLRFFQPREYLSLDFARQELLAIQVDADASGESSEASPLPAAPYLSDGAVQSGKAAASPPATHAAFSNQRSHPSPGLSLDKVSLTRAEPLRLELEDFLHAVRNRTTPRVDGACGRAALALALQITEEISAHARRSGLA